MWSKRKMCAHQFLSIFYTHRANMNYDLLESEHTQTQSHKKVFSSDNYYISLENVKKKYYT